MNAKPSELEHDSMEKRNMQCETHGPAFMTFICQHLAEDPRQTWHSHQPSEGNEWPDTWCDLCHLAFLHEGEWRDNNEKGLSVKLFCHRCYESHRSQQTRFNDVPEREAAE